MALTPQELTDIAYTISNRFELVTTKYITLMAKQIRQIGQLSASNLHRLEQFAIMGQNIDEINQELSKQTKLALNEIYELYDKSGFEEYGDVAYLYQARGIKQVPFSKNITIQNYIQSIKQLTARTFLNMSNTTSIQDNYRELVDTAITSVTMGVQDYNSAIRDILKQKANEGMRVKYASGHTRRLDSASRMNILEGVRQVNAGVRKESASQYGADGIEIDAHSLCADDHLPYQGRQYSIARYEAINNDLKRKIGTCNCHHGISYIILGVSPKGYTQKDLQQMKDYSHESITIGNKDVTRYEASQIMRQLETKMRYKKDEIIALNKAGIDFKKEKSELTAIQKQYRYVAEQAQLKKRYDRAYVPGYQGKQSKP